MLRYRAAFLHYGAGTALTRQGLARSVDQEATSSVELLLAHMLTAEALRTRQQVLGVMQASAGKSQLARLFVGLQSACLPTAEALHSCHQMQGVPQASAWKSQLAPLFAVLLSPFLRTVWASRIRHQMRLLLPSLA